MCGSPETPSRCVGSRRRGGPVEFKDLWPALRDELREARVAGDGLDDPDTEPALVATAYFSRAA